MYLKNNLYLKNKEINLLLFLFLSSLLIRVPIVLFFGDIRLENEWEILVNNLIEHRKLSLKNYEDVFVPNVFMPPLYGFYLYIFKIFNFSNDLYISIVLISQSLLSSFSVVIFYLINKNFFSKKICFIGALIFSFLPLHIYACGQISSIILQIFLIILFIYFFLLIAKKNNLLNICCFSFFSGLLILLRGEFIALFILTVFYLFLIIKTSLRKILIIVLLTTIVILPYLARNIIVLNEITITKSIGWNLWKGNHLSAGVEGYRGFDKKTNEKIEKVPKDKYHDINIDKIYLNEALNNILNNPKRFFNMYIKKAFSFIFIDFNSTYPNYYHPLNYIPILLLGLFSVAGIIVSNKKSPQMNYLILFFLANVAIVALFFVLPRYKLSIIPLQIIFSNIFFEYLKNKFFKKL